MPFNDPLALPTSQLTSTGKSCTLEATPDDFIENADLLLAAVENFDTEEPRTGPAFTGPAIGPLGDHANRVEDLIIDSDQSPPPPPSIDDHLPQPTTSGSMMSASVVTTLAASNSDTSSSASHLLMGGFTTASGSPTRTTASLSNEIFPGEAIFPAPTSTTLCTQFPIALKEVFFRVRADQSVEVHHKANFWRPYVIPQVNIENGAQIRLYYREAGKTTHALVPN